MGVPRYYVDVRYYACRAVVHPPVHRGRPILRHDLIRSVQIDQPRVGRRWPLKARRLEELLRAATTELGGEALVSIEEGGMVDEENPAALQDFVEMGEAERANAAAHRESISRPG